MRNGRVLPLLLLTLGVATSTACTSPRAKMRTAVFPASVEKIALPLPSGAVDPAFVSAGDRILLSWIDRDSATLRVASFSGKAWGEPVTIAGSIDLDAAAGRKPVIGVRSDGTRIAHWFDRREGDRVRRGWFAELPSGGAWSDPKPMPEGIGDGVGPLGWADVGHFPSVAWIGPWKQPLRPVADALFLAIPDTVDPTKVRTGVVQPRVNAAAGVDVLEVHRDILVEYAAKTRVEGTSFMVAFRKLGQINSSKEDVSYVEVVLVPPDGRSILAFGGAGERVSTSEDAREMRPRLFTENGIPVVAYYTPRGGGEIRFFPILRVDGKGRGAYGRKFLCMDPVTDFRVDVTGNRVALVTLEGGHLLLRRNSIERLTDVPLSAGSRIEWFGHIGDKRFIAWVEHPGRLVFAAIPPPPQ